MMIRVARGLSAKQTPALHDLRCEQAYVTQYVAESSARNVLSGPYSLTREAQFTAGETGRLQLPVEPAISTPCGRRMGSALRSRRSAEVLDRTFGSHPSSQSLPLL